MTTHKEKYDRALRELRDHDAYGWAEVIQVIEAQQRALDAIAGMATRGRSMNALISPGLIEEAIRDYLEEDQGDGEDQLNPTPEYNFWDDRTHGDAYSKQDPDRDLALQNSSNTEVIAAVRAALAKLRAATPGGRLPGDERIQWLKTLADRLELAGTFTFGFDDLSDTVTALTDAHRGRGDFLLADRLNKKYGASQRRRTGFNA